MNFNLKTKRDASEKRGHRILRYLLYAFAAGVLAVFLMVLTTAISVGKINNESLYSNIERSSILYDINGEQIDTLHYNQDREIVSINDMPDDLKNAFIAIEDKTFYEHHGFNFRRMFGAIFQSLTGGSRISGTSTITQQLARNAYLADIKSQRSIRRKLSEMYIAWRLEKSLTKDEILEAYLNTIYLGYGSYGVSAAAKTYFSKDVSELDLAESAALAALPQAPDSYALITNEPGDGRVEITDINYYTLDSLDEETESEEIGYTSYETTDETTGEEGTEEGTGFYANDSSKERRDLVLSLMTEQGFITQEQADSANVDIIEILKPSFRRDESTYTYFTDYVAQTVIKDLVDKYSMSEEEAQRTVYTGGLEIYTTLHSDIQNTICEEFKDDSNFPTAVDDSEVQAAMVVTEVGTGNISAMVGGRNANGAKLFNRAVSPRQPGSSIKPLSVYGAALQKSCDLAKAGKPFPYVNYGFDDQGIDGWGDYITASSTVVDEPLEIDGEEWPQNITRTFSGHNTFRTALQQSINTCAVKILWQVGLDYSMDMLEKFRLSTLVTDESLQSNDVNPAALGLGAMTYGVTPLDMSLAFAAFPSGGFHNTAVCYTKVVDSKNKELLKGKSEQTKVLDSGVAWIMTDLLKSVVSDGIAGSARISGMEVGGKTGTTDDLFDVWFDGFTPDYSAALWIGTDLNVEMVGGSYQAARLWGKIMGQITGIRDGEYLDMPKNVIEKNGEYYTEGTEKNAGRRITKSSGKKSKKDDDDEDEDNDNDNAAGGAGDGNQGSGSAVPAPDNSSSGTGGGGDSGSGSGGGSVSPGGDSGGTGGGGSVSPGGDSGSSGGGDSGGSSGGDSGGSSGGGDSGGSSGGGDSGGTGGGGDSGGGSGGGDSGGGGGSGGGESGGGGDSGGGESGE